MYQDVLSLLGPRTSSGRSSELPRPMDILQTHEGGIDAVYELARYQSLAFRGISEIAVHEIGKADHLAYCGLATSAESALGNYVSYMASHSLLPPFQLKDDIDVLGR